MSENEGSDSLRTRGEEALGELAQSLLENPVFNQALTTALGAGERASRAQRQAMGALHVPSTADVERLEQRLRSLSDRLESLEDRVDELGDELIALRSRAPGRRAQEGSTASGADSG